MRLHDYQKQAFRTANVLDRNLSSNQDMLVHAMLGLSSEVAEIIQDKDNSRNVIQEVGDCMWYIALACTALGFDLEDMDLNSFDPDIAHDDLISQCGIAADCVKRHVYYGTDINRDKLIKSLERAVTCLVVISGEANGDLHECMILNIDKLKLRYPEKYSNENAVNRNVKKEESLFDA